MLELAELIGCSSPNAAAEHVKALKKKGYITVAPGAARHYRRQNRRMDPVRSLKTCYPVETGHKAVEWLKNRE
jgi:repressor LexA